MPVPPYGHHLNEAMQTVATIVLWGGSVALLAYAVRLGRRERSILPVMLWVSVAVGSIIEPLYDIAYHLLWYTPGQWTLFTSFGLPQPVWVMPAYIMVFGLPAMLLYRRLAAGADLTFIFKVAALLVLTTAFFETTANNVDLYGYYGGAPMRLLKYPLWIAFMEAAQITGFAILCALLQRRATRPVHYLALMVVFPANFAFDVLGAGFPTIIAQNMPHPNTAVMWASAVASIALAATALWWTAQLLLWDQRTGTDRAGEVDARVAAQRVPRGSNLEGMTEVTPVEVEEIAPERVDEGDHDRFAHVVQPASAVMEAMITGVPCIALCGKRWVPSRDPKRYPVCPICKEIVERAGFRLPEG